MLTTVWKHTLALTRTHSVSFFPDRSYSRLKGKGKILPYSLPSVGPGADPGVQAVSPQVTWSHPAGGRLALLSVGPAVTFPAKECHRPSAGTKLYCLVTETHACEQLALGCYLEADRPRFEPATFWIASERSTVKPHRPLGPILQYWNFLPTQFRISRGPSLRQKLVRFWQSSDLWHTDR